MVSQNEGVTWAFADLINNYEGGLGGFDLNKRKQIKYNIPAIIEYWTSAFWIPFRTISLFIWSISVAFTKNVG